MKQYTILFLLGWTLAPFAQFVNKYIFDDWEFLKFLFVICSVDTCLGVLKAIKQKQVSSKGFGMVFNKLITYSAALICTHVLVHFTVEHKSYIVFSWMDSVIYSAIIVREALSIFENISYLQPGVFSASILKYLHQFDSLTGKPVENKQTQP